MPVQGGSPRLRTAFLVALAGLVAGLGLLALVLWLGSTGGVEVQLGDDTFEAGDAERIAAEITDRGPILYSDVAGGSRDIYLNHIGKDPATGWHAFSAQQPGAERDCYLTWDSEAEQFVDPCDGATFPADGAGLTRYPVYLRDDGSRVVVDLNRVRD